VHKGLEARIGTQWIEARPQQDTRVKSLFVAFFEPIDGLSGCASPKLYTIAESMTWRSICPARFSL
jgi:hypothetical protein